MKQEFPESLSVTTLCWDYGICENASILIPEFLQKLRPY